jgi:hypothetical protein
MKQIDDLFRDGLSGRKSAVPEDMWSRINSAKSTVPEGEQLDTIFATGLKSRVGKVPAGMWDRIVAARSRRPMRLLMATAAALLLLVSTVGYTIYQNRSSTNPLNGEFPMEQVAVPAEPVAIEEAVPAGNENIVEAFTPSRIEAETRVNLTTIPKGSGRMNEQAIPPESVREEPVSMGTTPSAASLALAESTAEADEMVTGERLPNTVEERAALYSVSEVPAASLALLPTDETAFPEIKRQYRPRANLTPAFPVSPRHRLQAELLFGVAYANQIFRESDASQLPLREIREVTEFPEVSYQITLRGTRKLGERMMLLGGITYAEIRNRVEYSQFINGSAVDIATNNQIRLLEAPILLGYRIPGRRLQVSMNAGPIFNLSTSARGRFLNPDLPVPQDLSTEGNYRNNIGVGLMASLSTTYRIGHKEPFLLVVEPFFKSYPGAFTVKDAPVREKYWVAGLQLGIRKSF